MTERRWSRRRWVAEHFSCDLSEVEPYQREKLVVQYEGRLVGVALTEPERAKVLVALDGRAVNEVAHWRDADVRLFIENRGCP